MTTTHSTPEAPASPPRRGAGDFTLLIGLAFAPLAFVLGGFAALLALPGVLFARLRPAAFAFFAGVCLCVLLSAAGINPWAAHVRERVLDEIEGALGARPQYANWSFNLADGEMRLDNLTFDLPELAGKAQLVQLTITAGPTFLWRADQPEISGRGLTLEFDGAKASPEAMLQRLEGASGGGTFSFESIEVRLIGQAATAVLRLDSARGESGDGFVATLGPRELALTVLERTHTLRLAGNAQFARKAGATRLSFDIKAGGDDVMAYLQGTLGEEDGLTLTLDHLDLQALWARYRVIDQQRGTARGTVRISGGLRELVLEPTLDLHEYGYYHRAVMALDESRAFRVPLATIGGRVRLVDGARLVVDELAAEVPQATLCTDPRMNARGGGRLVLRGEWPALTGEVQATVTAGLMAVPVSWSPLGASALADLQPNLIMVAEQFPQLALDWSIDVQKLDLACAPISGTLSGKLTGTLRKEPGSRQASLRAGGSLALSGGKLAFCAAAGDVSGSIEFNPQNPTSTATIRGAFTGQAGSTPLSAEIAGTLSHPGLVFTGVNMNPEDLGRVIATAGEMNAAEKARRAEDLTRLCGPAAAMNNNPFLASRAGKVSFSFRP